MEGRSAAAAHMAFVQSYGYSSWHNTKFKACGLGVWEARVQGFKGVGTTGGKDCICNSARSRTLSRHYVWPHNQMLQGGAQAQTGIPSIGYQILRLEAPRYVRAESNSPSAARTRNAPRMGGQEVTDLGLKPANRSKAEAARITTDGPAQCQHCPAGTCGARQGR